jgi:phosphate transport system permease protein
MHTSFHELIKGKKSHAKRHQQIMILLFILSSVLVTIFLFFILQEIIVKGVLSLRLEFFLEREYGVGATGGFLNAIVGSLQLVGIALGVAAPLSIGSAIYVQEYAKRSNIFTKIILFTSDTLASTPSIVFGAFGFTFFVWYLHFGFSVIAGGLTLAIMVMPLMLRSSIEAIKSVPFEYQEGSFALGATKWQTIRHVVLPPSLPGIIGGVILSIGRAIGETAAVIFTAGYAVHVAGSLLHPVASIPNLIFKNYQFSTKYPVLGEKVYAAAFILIIIVLVLNSLARLAGYRSSKMMKRG